MAHAAPAVTESAVEKEPARQAGQITGLDWALAGVALIVTLVLRTLYIRALPWHSDEPQHLHVVWGWATGRLPYRDVFDNHSPLFGFSMSLIFRLFDERNDIIEVMRWVMLPLYGICLWCLYRLGSIAGDRRTGLWAAILGGWFGPWFLKMAEFRTDVLWTTLWMVTLAIACSGTLTVRRCFFAGLTLGAAFSVSMKSPLMLMSILAAAGVTWVLMRRKESSGATDWKRGAAMAGAAIAGLLLIPGLFVLFFVRQGAGWVMYYCVIQHNLAPGGHPLSAIVHRIFHKEGLLIPFTLAAAWAVSARSEGGARTARKVFLLCVTGFFCPILVSVWPIVTPQDYAPLWPLVGGCAAVAALAGGEWLWRRLAPTHPAGTGRFATTLLLGFAAALEVVWIVSIDSPAQGPANKNFRDNLSKIEAIKEARELTKPGEYIMDAKGENIYRPRPYWYVLETLTRKRLYGGDLPDDLPARLISTRTAVAIPSQRMMEDSMEFVKENYLPVGLWSVAGKLLPRSATSPMDFEIVIPQRYTLVTRTGPAQGILDGKPFAGPLELAAGHHTFERTGENSQIAVIWAQAVERGFSAFHSPASLTALGEQAGRAMKK